MTRTLKTALTCVAAAVFMSIVLAQQPTPPAEGLSQQGVGGRGRGSQPPPPPPVDPTPEELAKVREKTEQIEKLVGELRAKHSDPVLLNDVEVYAKAGRMLLEYPELFGTQA